MSRGVVNILEGELGRESSCEIGWLAGGMAEARSVQKGDEPRQHYRCQGICEYGLGNEGPFAHTLHLFPELAQPKPNDPEIGGGLGGHVREDVCLLVRGTED